MRRYTDTTFRGELDVVKSLSGRMIEASVKELRATEDLTKALRAALKIGVSISDLSAECGLTPEEIRKRVTRQLVFDDELATLSGIS